MKYRKLLLFILIIFGSCFTSRGQFLVAPTCPPNIDFELGNLSYWHFFNGTVFAGPVYSISPTSPVFGWETLTAGTGLDPYGFFPIVDPGGGFYALKLGTDINGARAQRAVYYVDVPPGVTDYSLIYRYAVVLEDPPHIPSQQPRFVVSATDSATGLPIPCAQDNYVAGAIPGFFASGVSAADGNGPDVIYKPWATASINLAGLEGHTVSIEITAAGCSPTGHFGYGYVDMTCGLFAIDAKICDDTLATLTGPSGFEVYSWYDSILLSKGILISLGNTQTITMPIPDSETTFAVIIEPYIGFGCPDTLYTRVMPSYLKTHPSNDTLVCAGTPVIMTTGATDSALDLPLQYNWTPAVAISCTNCPLPIASPTVTTTYYATVTDKAGCSAGYYYYFGR